MKYDILKFDATYGPPIYRVWRKSFPWGSWIKSSDGSVLSFETKEAAHSHMRALAQAARPKPVTIKAPGRVAA